MPKRQAPAPSEFIASNVESIRRRKQWTQQELADAMGQWSGAVRFDRSTIAKIESRKRAVSIDELLWLAWSLEVSPMALLFPHRSLDYIRIAPDFVLQLAVIVDWYRGFGLPAATDDAQRFFEEQRPDWEVLAERQLPGVLGLATRASGVVSALTTGVGRRVDSRDVAAALLDDLIEHATRLRQSITSEERTELLERLRRESDGD